MNYMEFPNPHSIDIRSNIMLDIQGQCMGTKELSEKGGIMLRWQELYCVTL